MIGKFVWWFIAFALSFLAQSVGWAASQGVAFFYIYLFPKLFILAIFLFLCLFATDSFLSNISISFVFVIRCAIALALTLFLPWIISLLFNVDFYLAYQIVSFISCAFNNRNRN